MNVPLQIVILTVCNVLFSYFLFYSTLYYKTPVGKNAYFLLAIITYSIVSYYVLQNMYYTESFFFEVSPQRKQCLEEQVLPVPYRSCQCCGKGTVGGYPTRYLYKDLIGNEDGWDWNRVDAFGKEASITPPTDTCAPAPSSGSMY